MSFVCVNSIVLDNSKAIADLTFLLCAVSQTLTPRCGVMIGKEKESRLSMKLSSLEFYARLFYLTMGWNKF